MSFPESIESYNYNFLSQIKEGKKVGLDDAGRLYYLVKDAKSSAIAKSVFENVVLESVITKLKEKQFQDLKTGRSEYLKVIDQFVRTKLLTNDQKNALVLSYYKARYKNLVESGLKEEAAEAMVACEMGNDPNLPEDYRKKLEPQFVITGSSGVYFLKDTKGNNIGVFKPRLQEPYMSDNPKGHRPQKEGEKPKKVRMGHVNGTGWLSEVGAYEVDKEGYMGVPYTTKMALSFAKKWTKAAPGKFVPDKSSIVEQEGSFQLFIHGVETVAEVSPKYEDIPTEEVQKTLALDIAIGNSDRNSGNIFWDEKLKKLIPIDHGLTFLENLNWEEPLTYSEGWTEMYTWPQVKEALNDKTKKWISEYDLDEKCKALRRLGISEEAIRDHRVRILFLKEGVKQGLNLHQLGKLSLVIGNFTSATTWLDNLVKTQRDALKDLSKLKGEEAQKLFEDNFKKTLEEELTKQKGKI